MRCKSKLLPISDYILFRITQLKATLLHQKSAKYIFFLQCCYITHCKIFSNQNSFYNVALRTATKICNQIYSYFICIKVYLKLLTKTNLYSLPSILVGTTICIVWGRYEAFFGDQLFKSFFFAHF